MTKAKPGLVRPGGHMGFGGVIFRGEASTCYRAGSVESVRSWSRHAATILAGLLVEMEANHV